VPFSHSLAKTTISFRSQSDYAQQLATTLSSNINFVLAETYTLIRFKVATMRREFVNVSIKQVLKSACEQAIETQRRSSATTTKNSALSVHQLRIDRSPPAHYAFSLLTAPAVSVQRHVTVLVRLP
jgi:hypothetical protein